MKKHLRELTHLDFSMYEDDKGKMHYILESPVVHTSKRYGKTATIPSGFDSDGGSGPAEDIVSLGWWVHDWLCRHKLWDDGSPCPPFQSSMVLHDILMRENRWFRAKTWFIATFIHQLCVYKPADRQPPTRLDMSRLPIALA